MLSQPYGCIQPGGRTASPAAAVVRLPVAGFAGGVGIPEDAESAI
jgi:hypothetical protein